MKTKFSRREALKKFSVGSAALALVQGFHSVAAAGENPQTKGRLKLSVCRGAFSKIPDDIFYPAAKASGLVGIDLLNPSDFATLKKHGLICSMVSYPTVDGLGGIQRAFNRVEHHDKLVQAYERRLQETAAAGYHRLICFSGNRDGLDDEKGLANCAEGLKKILPLAEKLQVTLCMELLNSKRSHKDYQCDHTAWGVELVKRISSERFKLLYDIFHMQIMEGDLCDTIRENHEFIDHYHTGGVPGRGEIDETQEINYHRVMQTIADTGFQGYVAQEFSPKRPDALALLRQAIKICTV